MRQQFFWCLTPEELLAAEWRPPLLLDDSLARLLRTQGKERESV